MLRAILVDDEINSTDVLHWQLNTYCPSVNVLCECNTPEDALEKISTLQPDVVFLDIEMPGMNGFELLSKLKPLTFDVIFITAYNQFAVKAFRENAADYLLKPVEKEDLKAAVEKVMQREKHQATEKLDSMLKIFKEQMRATRKIALPTNDGIAFLNVDQIIRIESESNYSFVFLVSGEKVCITKTLKQVEEALEDQPFYRVHQSHIVNLHHIQKFVREDGGYLVMSDRSNITVARQRKEGFLELFSRL